MTSFPRAHRARCERVAECARLKGMTGARAVRASLHDRARVGSNLSRRVSALLGTALLRSAVQGVALQGKAWLRFAQQGDDRRSLALLGKGCGYARRGMASQGAVGQRADRFGAARLVHARRSTALRGNAGHCSAALGLARPVIARRGTAEHGGAVHCIARSGVARRGAARRVYALHGSACRGFAWHCTVGQGVAVLGKDWR